MSDVLDYFTCKIKKKAKTKVSREQIERAQYITHKSEKAIPYEVGG